MRHMKITLGVIITTLLIISAPAQSKPDFSGRWTSEPETQAPASARTGDMGSGWGANLTITQTANRLTVEYVFFARGDMQPPMRFIYALDGTETKNSVMMGRGNQVQTSKTAWEGDTLIITTAHSFDNPVNGQPMKAEVRQTLALASPTSLTVETTRSGVLSGPPSMTRTVYKKN